MLAVVCVQRKSPRPLLIAFKRDFNDCFQLKKEGKFFSPIVELHADGSAELLRYGLQEWRLGKLVAHNVLFQRRNGLSAILCHAKVGALYKEYFP